MENGLSIAHILPGGKRGYRSEIYRLSVVKVLLKKTLYSWLVLLLQTAVHSDIQKHSYHAVPLIFVYAVFLKNTSYGHCQ